MFRFWMSCELSNQRAALTLTYSLVVERHQLTAGVPKQLRHEVGRVDSGSFRVDPTQLGFIISGERTVKINYRES